MDTSSVTQSRENVLKRFAWVISALVITILIIHSIILFYSQITANKIVIETGNAIQAAVSGNSGSPADFLAAIQYMEATQNAYSADTSSRFLSLVYTILTTVVLGWGSKMLLIGAEERKELMDKIQTEAGLKYKEESQRSMSKFKNDISNTLRGMQSEFSSETQNILRTIEDKYKTETENRLFLQSAIFVATTSCRNAAHICILLQAFIQFMDQMGNVEEQETPEFTDNLQVDFIHSLEQLQSFLLACEKDKENYTMTKEEKELMVKSWKMATDSIKGYINEGGDPTDSPLYRMFDNEDYSGDYDVVMGLYKEICERIQKLSDSDS